MRFFSPSWTAALRIARRDALRARGRSALVVAMVALPVLGLSFADVTARSAQLDSGERATQIMRGYDAEVRAAIGLVQQTPDGLSWGSSDAPAAAGPTTSGDRGATATDPPSDRSGELRRALPPGSQIRAVSSTSVAISTSDATTVALLSDVDPADPLLAGRYHLRSGRRARSVAEVTLSPQLAAILGVRAGDRVSFGSAERTVVGIIENLDAPPGEPIALGPLPPGSTQGSTPDWLVTVPGGLPWAAVLRLNDHGFVATSRAVLLHPPARSEVPIYRSGQFSSAPTSTSVVAVLAIALAVGLAGLEVVLLAGAAFAVGARRQARGLGVVGAAGGTPRDVRRIVLAGGVWLGLAGGVVGTALGILSAVLLRGPLESYARQRFGRVDLHLWELLALVALGFGTGVLAAMLPARTASRQDVVAVLTGRRRDAPTRKRVPVIGLALAAVGVAATLLASGRVIAARQDVRAIGDSERTVLIGGLVLGATLTVLGLVVASPAVVGLAGRLARWLPLAPRLALRDAARHRGRSAPAVAAVIAAVSGGMALSLYFAALGDHDRRDHVYQALPGQAVVELLSYGDGDVPSDTPLVANPDAVRAAIGAIAPVSAARLVRMWSCGSSCGAEVMLPAAQRCPGDDAQGSAPPSQQPPASSGHDPRCQVVQHGSYGFPGAGMVATAADLPFLVGATSRAARDVLDRGGVVVDDPRLVFNGKVTVQLSTESVSAGSGTITAPGSPPASDPGAPGAAASKNTLVELPGVALISSTPGFSYRVIYSPGAVSRLHGTIGPAQLRLNFATTPDNRTEARLAAAVTRPPLHASLRVERGYTNGYRLALIALALGSGLITLGAVGIATGLAQADARPDHATLAAVGASPRLRRLLAASSAGTLALLGSLLGAAAGLVPAIGVIRMSEGMHLIVPWPTVLGLVIGLPLLAALLTGLSVRSRLPLERRVA